MKSCSRCKQTKSVTEFHKLHDGYQPRCKTCTSEVQKIRYQANQQKMIERSREYRAKNPDKVKATKLAWKRANKKKNVESAVRYQQKYPEKHVRATSAYRRRNQDKYRNYAQSRRVRQENNGVFLVTEEEIRKILAQPCANCNSYDRPSLDHIVPISLGGTHSVGNLQNLCMPCNSSKGNKVMTVWKKSKDANIR